MAKTFHAEAIGQTRTPTGRTGGKEWRAGRAEGWGAPVSPFRFKGEKTLSVAQEGVKLDIRKFLWRSHTVGNEASSARSDRTLCADGNVLWLSCPTLQPPAKCGHGARKTWLSETAGRTF